VNAALGPNLVRFPPPHGHYSDSDCDHPTQGYRSRKEDQGTNALDDYFVPLHRGQPPLDVLEDLDGAIEKAVAMPWPN
jgi:hypothetical protein